MTASEERLNNLQKNNADLTKILQIASQEWRATVDGINDAICLLDLEGRILRCNRSMANLFKMNFNDIIGKRCYELIHKTAKPVDECPFLVMRKTQRREHAVLQIEERWFNISIDPLLDDNGMLLGAVHIMTDITERKQAEEALKTEKAYLEQLFETAQEAIVMADTTGKVIRVNKEFCRLFKYRFDEVKDKMVDELIVPEEMLREARAVTRDVGEGKGVALESFRIAKDGSHLDVSILASPIMVEGKQVAVYTIYRDITEQKRAEQKLKASVDKLQKTIEGAVYAMAKIVETRDPYTAGHQSRVALLAVEIAKVLELTQEKIIGLYMAALIHDIGKIYIPAEILSRPTKLSETEFALIKRHPILGCDILKTTIEFPWPVTTIVLQHHERINGTGYPQGLKGLDIILEARILAVADVVEAMCSHRPYRPARSMSMTMKEIHDNKGILYDPSVVEVCMRLFEEKNYRFFN
jgi:PAS domain S-box-containing protein